MCPIAVWKTPRSLFCQSTLTGFLAAQVAMPRAWSGSELESIPGNPERGSDCGQRPRGIQPPYKNSIETIVLRKSLAVGSRLFRTLTGLGLLVTARLRVLKRPNCLDNYFLVSYGAVRPPCFLALTVFTVHGRAPVAMLKPHL